MLVALTLATWTPSALAAAAGDPNEAITFEPAFVFVDARPGERVTRTVLVKNQTRAAAALTAEMFDMAAGPGASTAFEYLPLGEAPRGAGSWVEPRLAAGTATDGVLRLPAGEQARVRVSIRVPSEAGAGGHYAAVMFTGRDPRGDQQVQGEIEVPVPILISVAGDSERDLRVRVRPDDGFRWGGGRATWVVELRNEGDVHEVFAGRLNIDGLVSGPRRHELRPGILLPGERRTLRVRDELREAPDRHVAKVTIARETGGAIHATAPSLFVLPWWLLVLVAAAIALVTWRVRRRRAAWRDYREGLPEAAGEHDDSRAG
ncbi:MAG: hypothetical protein JWM86_737 [Thermoleophilia bacterium]|nr:hypothetical protein [Thermoleophilia bacterium]